MERRQKSLYPLTQRNDKEGSSDVTDEPSISPWHWSVHRRLLTADICNDLPDIFPSTELHTRSAIHPGSAGKALENTQPVVSGELVDKCTCLLTHLPDGPTLPPPSPHRTELQSPTLVNRLVLLSSLPLLTRPADFPGIFSQSDCLNLRPYFRVLEVSKLRWTLSWWI